MKSSRKGLQDIDISGQPETREEKGLTAQQKKILEKTMQRHDEAFKKLAMM